MKKHLASCAIIGMWGKRCGTRFVASHIEVEKIRGEPWFRFRNAECEALHNEWLELKAYVEKRRKK